VKQRWKKKWEHTRLMKTKLSCSWIAESQERDLQICAREGAQVNDGDTIQSPLSAPSYFTRNRIKNSRQLTTVPQRAKVPPFDWLHFNCPCWHLNSVYCCTFVSDYWTRESCCFLRSHREKNTKTQKVDTDGLFFYNSCWLTLAYWNREQSTTTQINVWWLAVQLSHR
jgi:hypothetical protein